ncbi:hypothetical protein K2173_005064 [Erythroxylum novogranatense]|uniref:RING-CH-type domain-containing protein n=1 Tax=Erythroxylum novogranatense TaxID=1862640 RepID=A0AAV8TBB4_9ROSI|nr:hypothetical protein K2173_005064 [Erythroxylum novogranatense]
MDNVQTPHHVVYVEDVEESNKHQSDGEEDKRRRSSTGSGSGREIVKDGASSVSELDLEFGLSETKVHSAKVESECRICHLSLDPGNQVSELPIELGCSCKDDLASAHKHCAEAWFKIKGNKTCEICGSVARNVAVANENELVEHWNEVYDGTVVPGATTGRSAETGNFWQGRRFLNLLLACMVFAFVISWLFHFNVPS